jgi:hypothetical protein
MLRRDMFEVHAGSESFPIRGNACQQERGKAEGEDREERAYFTPQRREHANKKCNNIEGRELEI